MALIYTTLGIYMNLGGFLGLVIGVVIHTLNCDSVCAAVSGSLAGITSVFIASMTNFCGQTVEL